MYKQVTDGIRQEENNNREMLLRPLECQAIKWFVVVFFLNSSSKNLEGDDESEIPKVSQLRTELGKQGDIN